MPESTAKKYYWLRLHRDFFKRHDIQIVEGMPNGKDYILFYLKLLVESVDHEGALRFSDAIPYSAEMLATITHTNVDIVRSAMKVFTELQMISILDDDTIFMEEVQRMIGCAEQDEHTRESTRLRVQKHRQKQKLLQDCYSNVTCNVEKEIEKEIEIDIKDNMSCDIETIVSYLNQKCGTKYQSSSQKTRKLIRARLNEKFTVEDFKTVIDKKVAEWKDDAKMQQYLRPETLFGTKFEGYLNKKTVNKTQNTFNTMMHTDYDIDELERKLLAN